MEWTAASDGEYPNEPQGLNFICDINLHWWSIRLALGCVNSLLWPGFRVTKDEPAYWTI